MPHWLKRVRGALVLGLVWGAFWAVVGSVIMEGIVDPNGELLDMWPPLLGIAGFLAGVIFSVVIALAGRQRRLDALSLGEFASWGAVTGVVLGALAMLTGAPGYFAGMTVLGGTLAASGSHVIVRWAAPRQLDGGDDAVPGSLPGGRN